MQLSADDISIGVTMYRRLDFLEQALASAVNQTVRVRVLLHDDGCLDRRALDRMLARFGGRVEYHRNEANVRQFGNMNLAIRRSPTPWLSVLHDDDMLAPDFVERILEVAPEVGACALFCGATTFVSRDGTPFFHKNECPPGERWRMVPLREFAAKNQFAFPGQLMHRETTLALGGFPQNSVYSGDWDMWFRLALAGGAAQLAATLSFYRSHESDGRYTSDSNRSGRKAACCAMQVKRNLARLRASGRPAAFDRAEWLEKYGPLYRELLLNAPRMPRWLLRYNRRILLLTRPATGGARALHWLSRLCGNPGVRLAGRLHLLRGRLGLRMPQTF